MASITAIVRRSRVRVRPLQQHYYFSTSTTTTTTSPPPNNNNNNNNWHYAGTDGQQTNTSPINLDNHHSSIADLERRYPQFRQRPQGTYALLQPGDLLYIPAKWWHHVRSLDTAASVNVWFR
mmetsp:Transcript_17235/g.39975  ORF Transcript_17235/g.39975 Transcript_17235/m.39975 type:complete len:122 (-) Transcript_17235:61-426(-)